MCWRYCRFDESGILKVFVLFTGGDVGEIRFNESLTEEVVMRALRFSLERYPRALTAHLDVRAPSIRALVETASGKVLSWHYSGVMVEIVEL